MGISEYLTPTVSIICLGLCKSLMLALPLAHIILGVKYLNECPQQNYIPVFILVCGVVSITMILLSCLCCCQQDHPTVELLCSIWNSLVSGFSFCWFISGSVWTYTIYPPNYNSNVAAVPYCNKTLYQFVFWNITLVYIALVILLLGTCCFYTCLYLCSRRKLSEAEPQA